MWTSLAVHLWGVCPCIWGGTLPFGLGRAGYFCWRHAAREASETIQLNSELTCTLFLFRKVHFFLCFLRESSFDLCGLGTCNEDLETSKALLGGNLFANLLATATTLRNLEGKACAPTTFANRGSLRDGLLQIWLAWFLTQRKAMENTQSLNARYHVAQKTRSH